MSLINTPAAKSTRKAAQRELNRAEVTAKQNHLLRRRYELIADATLQIPLCSSAA